MTLLIAPTRLRPEDVPSPAWHQDWPPLVQCACGRRLRVVSVDPVALVRGRAEQWEAMTEERVASLGYEPWERFTCFLNEIVETTPGEDFEHLDGVTLGHDDEDYDWRWTREQADALDADVAPPNEPVLHCEGQTAMFDEEAVR